MSEQIQIKYDLPEKYTYADKDSIHPEEVLELREACSWSPGNTEVWKKIIEESIATIGVRNPEGDLVGLGFLVGNSRHAILCDFTVHPDYRSEGIGKAILDRRMAIAKEKGIANLYAEIADTNTLKSRYEELGFKEANDVLKLAKKSN